MFGAVGSLILSAIGLLGAVVPIPLVLPIFGLILGINGLLKEKKRTEKCKKVMVLCTIGIITNTLATACLLLGGLMGRR